MIVLDSSAAFEWVLGLSRADAVAERIASAESLHAPALMDVEVVHVLRRYATAGEITTRTAERALGALADLNVRLHTHELLLSAIWRLRHNLTAYDAAFVALAAVLDVPLLTLDTRIAHAPLPCFATGPVVIDLIT